MSMAEKKWIINTYYTLATPGPHAIPDTWETQSFMLNKSGSGGIQQGTANYNRIGSKIYVRSIEYRFIIKPTGGAGMDLTGGNNCRFIVYHNKQTNGAQVTGAQLFFDNTVTSVRNGDNLKQFSVLRDTIMSMVPTSATTIGPAFPVVGSIRVMKMFDFGNNGGTITDLIKDDYGFAMIADKATCCEIYGSYNVHFTDF